MNPIKWQPFLYRTEMEPLGVQQSNFFHKELMHFYDNNLHNKTTLKNRCRQYATVYVQKTSLHLEYYDQRICKNSKFGPGNVYGIHASSGSSAWNGWIISFRATTEVLYRHFKEKLKTIL